MVRNAISDKNGTTCFLVFVLFWFQTCEWYLCKSYLYYMHQLTAPFQFDTSHHMWSLSIWLFRQAVGGGRSASQKSKITTVRFSLSLGLNLNTSPMEGKAILVRLWWLQPFSHRLSITSSCLWRQPTMSCTLSPVREEKPALSCCLSVGISKLITEMHSFFRLGSETCSGRVTCWTNRPVGAG